MSRRKKRFLFLASFLFLLGIGGYSVWKIVGIQQNYAKEAKTHEALLLYRPGGGNGNEAGAQSTLPNINPNPSLNPDSSQESQGMVPEEFVENQEIIRLRQEHPAAVGWVSVPGTKVEYPFVQGSDNEYYLHKDIDGNYLYAGIPFLDYRNDPAFGDDNSIIYGHHMKNEALFGTLEWFKEEDFFRENRYFYVYLPYQTIKAEIVACLVIDPNRKEYLYRIQPEADHLNQVLRDARQALETEPDPSQRFITLSTCDYEFDGARVVIVGIVCE